MDTGVTEVCCQWKDTDRSGTHMETARGSWKLRVGAEEAESTRHDSTLLARTTSRQEKRRREVKGLVQAHGRQTATRILSASPGRPWFIYLEVTLSTVFLSKPPACSKQAKL